MSRPQFVYVTYIRTTSEKLWSAFTGPEFTRQYWFGIHHETDWKAGSTWRLVSSDGRIFDTGEIVESDPPRHLVIKWRHELRPELKAEGYSRCTIDIEQVGEAVKLTVVHDEFDEGSKAFESISNGWPAVLSSLKSFLEIGRGLEPWWDEEQRNRVAEAECKA